MVILLIHYSLKKQIILMEKIPLHFFVIIFNPAFHTFDFQRVVLHKIWVLTIPSMHCVAIYSRFNQYSTERCPKIRNLRMRCVIIRCPRSRCVSIRCPRLKCHSISCPKIRCISIRCPKTEVSQDYVSQHQVSQDQVRQYQVSQDQSFQDFWHYDGVSSAIWSTFRTLFVN